MSAKLTEPKSPPPEQLQLSKEERLAFLVQSKVPWFTIDESALYTRRSHQTIRTLLHSGKLRAAQLGNTYLIARDDLDALLTKLKRKVPAYRKGSRPWVAERHERKRLEKKRPAR